MVSKGSTGGSRVQQVVCEGRFVSPASNHIVERLVPALTMSNSFSKSHVLGAWDISDAYLQVPQEVPRRISILDDTNHSGLVINRCLPGQRDGSRRWFEHFSSFLTSKLNLSPCLEQPALFRIPQEDGGGALLMHVDDVLFSLDERYLCRSSCLPFGRRSKQQ